MPCNVQLHGSKWRHYVVSYKRGIVAAMASALAAAGAAAAERPVTVSVRANALHASGDMYGAGLALSMRLNNGWFAAGTLDNYYYAPSTLTSATAARPQLQSLVFGAAMGRRIPSRYEGLDWFWSAGLAAGLPQGYRPQDTKALDSGTQVHLTMALGGIRQLGAHWSVSAALRIERHYIDIRYRDEASGDERRLSTLTPAGLYLSVNYRF